MSQSSDFTKRRMLCATTVFGIILVAGPALVATADEFVPHRLIVRFAPSSVHLPDSANQCTIGEATGSTGVVNELEAFGAVGLEQLFSGATEADSLDLGAQGDTVMMPDLANVLMLTLDGNADVLAIADSLRLKSYVVYAEPDWLGLPTATPDDPQFGAQWYARGGSRSRIRDGRSLDPLL
jgi:hypothetical protein